MCKPIYRVARVVLAIAITGLLISVDGADGKPDKKKSQAAYQQGVGADQAGRREEAIAAYTEAIEADSGNAAALRARGKDYFKAGNREKAAADFETAVVVQPGDAQSYFARGQFFNDTGQPERAAQDFTTALSPVSYTHLDVYKRQGTRWPPARAVSPWSPCRV